MKFNQIAMLYLAQKQAGYFINSLLVFLGLCLCLGCNGQVLKKETAISKYEDSEILNQFKDGKKEGLWRDHYQNGQVKSEGIFVFDSKEGHHKEWGENGILTSETFYINGKENGLVTWYHEKGHIAGQGKMIDGIRFGKWIICDIEENGFCIEAYFNDGMREGIWKINHASARDKLWKEQTWKDDKIVSEKCWDEHGQIIECK